MDRRDAITWVQSVCSGLRASQSKTLAVLATAVLAVERISLAAIGRQVEGTTAKHGIKRVDRFLGNNRFSVGEGMQGLIQRLLRRHGRQALVVALDWVEVRNFHTLALVQVGPGRGLPLLWASYPEWELYKSQNNLEEGLLRLLRTLVPDSVPVILLADRGFGRTEMARLCQHLGFHYVIRIAPDVWVRCRRFHGKLLDYPVKKGICHRLRAVAYRRHHPVQQHVVIHWRRGLPKERDECWFLMTDLDWSGRTLVELYGQRMTIEQVFRDQKNRRAGWALRNLQVTQARRLDRLLLVLAYAYVLLVGVGHYCRAQFCPSLWSSNTRPNDCSAFTIGRIMLGRVQLSPRDAFAALRFALAGVKPKWG
jgi:Transposase DDE domain